MHECTKRKYIEGFIEVLFEYDIFHFHFASYQSKTRLSRIAT